MGNWWLAISSWQCACTCTPSCAIFFCKTSKCPDDSAHLQHRFGALWYWLFPKLQSPLKEKRFQSIDEIQENTMGHLIEILTKFCRVFWTVEETLEELCEVPRCLLIGDWDVIVLCIMFLVLFIFFNKCLYFLYYMAGYILNRTCMLISQPWNEDSKGHSLNCFVKLSQLESACDNLHIQIH